VETKGHESIFSGAERVQNHPKAPEKADFISLGANHRCAADLGEGRVFVVILVYSPVFRRVERGKGKLTTIEYLYRGMAQLVKRVFWD